MKFLARIVKVIFELAAAGFAAWLLFLLSFLFAHPILDGVLVGNDSAFAISLMGWFERFWPQVPLWYPLQGAGVSLFHSYPMLTTFLGILVRNMSQLSLVEVYRILSFATFPLTAWGVYVFARYKTGNHVAAFFAGVFFLLSQATWVFQRLHGIFAQSFSLVFVPWCFLFFDLWISMNWQGKRGWGKRLVLVLGAVVTALGFLTHVVTGMVLALGLLVYAVIYSQSKLVWRLAVRERVRSIGKVILLTTVFVGLGVGLAAFWLVPFYSYQQLANREGLLTMNMGQLKEVSLRPQTLVGFGEFATGDLRYDYFFFALPVLVLAAVGLIGGLLSNGSMMAWGLVAFGALVFTSLPLYLPMLVRLFQYVFTAIYFRALVAAIVLLPVVAGFGALFIVDFPFMILNKLIGKILGKGKSIIKSGVRVGFKMVRLAVVSVGVLLVAIWAIDNYKHEPPGEEMRKRPAYGLTQFRAYGPTLGKEDEYDRVKSDLKLLLTKPHFEINKEGLGPSPSLVGFIKDFQLGEKSRVDVSAYSGENFLQYAPMITDASFVNLYHYSASIIHRMWGYQQGVFYGHESLYDNPMLLAELSKWFGVEYTVVVPGFDREENYLKTGWELVKPGGSAENRLPIYKFGESEGLLSVEQKPVALVIGSIDGAAYDQVFKTSNAGALAYDDLWLVEGGERLDKYSANELSKFDLIILSGYDYKNRGKFWRIVKDYVNKGGSLFIDTGWQFVSRDWGRKDGKPIELPEPMPIARTIWGNVGEEWKDFVINPRLVEVEVDGYKPWLWAGSQWGAAVGSSDDLREGGEALITSSGGVVMAQREFGEGKIIWSGLNLFAHAQGPEGEKEVDFIKEVFSWLLAGKEKKEYSQVTFTRDYPDEVKISFKEPTNNVWVLWREAYSPNWNGRLIKSKKKVKLYRAGPGFSTAYLPELSEGETLQLTYKLKWFESMGAAVVSLLTLAGLAVYLIRGRVVGERRFLFVKNMFMRVKKRAVKMVREEEDY